MNPTDDKQATARSHPTSSLSRRRLLAGAGTLAMAPAFAREARAARRHVVVVGAGFGGATCARYLKLWGGDRVDVTLVDRRGTHVSCVMSNLVLNDELGLGRLSFDLRKMASKHDIRFVQDTVDLVEHDIGRLLLRDGAPLSYDHVVLSPGIEFSRIPGWDRARMPHAWVAGRQTLLLRQQLRTMPADGTFLMTVPKAPYRCPPGPYERACLVADYLGRRARAERRAQSPRVIVLDANEGITAEREIFGRAFADLYGDIIEYYPGIQVRAASASHGALDTDMGSFTGDVVNLIANHEAPRLLRRSGLLDGHAWAPVDPVTYASTVGGEERVHIIGDSQATGQPKSGHMANAQAKVCADAILRSLAGVSPYAPERLANLTTNSACFSPITRDEASWLTAVFAYDIESGQMKLVGPSLGEAEDWNSENYAEMFNWSKNLFADTFI